MKNARMRGKKGSIAKRCGLRWCLKQLFVQTAGRGQLAIHEKHYHVYAPLKQFLSLYDV